MAKKIGRGPRLTNRQRGAIKAARTRKANKALAGSGAWFLEVMDVDAAELRESDPEGYDIVVKAALERASSHTDRYKNRPGGALATFLEYIGIRNPELSDRGIAVGETP